MLIISILLGVHTYMPDLLTVIIAYDSYQHIMERRKHDDESPR